MYNQIQWAVPSYKKDIYETYYNMIINLKQRENIQI